MAGAGLVVSSQSQVSAVPEPAVAAVKNCPRLTEPTLGFLWEGKSFFNTLSNMTQLKNLSGWDNNNIRLKTPYLALLLEIFLLPLVLS